MKAFRLGLRMLAREARGGTLGVVVAAVAVGVAALAAVGTTTDRIQRGLRLGAAELLAADLAVTGHAPPPPALEAEAGAAGLAAARWTETRTMVAAGGGLRLVELKAVSAGYPLRGRLRVADAPFAPDRPAAAPPAPGEAWVDARLAADGLAPGAEIRLGEASLRVTAVLTYEPDRGGDLLSIGPRVLIRLEDLAATGLLAPGSHAHHALLLAGPGAALARLRAAHEGEDPALRWAGVEDARPELRLAMERAGRYLGLAGLATLLLAGAGAGLGLRRHLAREATALALLRTFGAGRRTVLAAALAQLAGIAAAGSAAGLALGLLAHLALLRLAGGLVGPALPPPGAGPLLTAAAAGAVAVLAFGLPAALQAAATPPMQTLRATPAPLPPAAALARLAAVLAVAALALHVGGDLRTVLWAGGGLALAAAAVAAATAGLMHLGAPLARRSGPAWRLGLAFLLRHRRLHLAEATVFGLALAAVLLVGLVRGDLLAAWQRDLPHDAPDRFLINIQPSEVEALRAFLARHGIADAPLYPMVRARLVAIGARRVRPEDYHDPRARRLAVRDFNLSWSEAPPEGNALAAGRWWGADPGTEFSVETGLAETLGIRLGDRLRFEIAGEPLEGVVTSLRTVRWGSMRVNFFVLAEPGALEGRPATWITAFRLPPGRQGLEAALHARFPGVTVLDVSALVAQVRGVMDRLAGAVQVVFLLTVLAGITVLYAGARATAAERREAAALMRALGARRGTVLAACLTEYLLLGLATGLAAAAVAAGAGVGVAEGVLDLAYRPRPLLWLAGAAAGAAGITLAGLAGTREALTTPPLAVLRGT
ncbi:ABC transporter permease [Inmirania thermothiophila]|uniref:Putative ABC transport system permease protein n=1 Tax=Inmirania thermothiophila TaxID=1750597 RepID=A0A3N1YCS8_9GAMM|nr:FtsX-like permease family protein [Inmirania thermothiophila]ROR35197.1 putative ABC transport system permease protein [Inmirania thermothiophila]